MSPSSFDVLVVGAGLIGAAAAKHLAKRGLSVGVVGPGRSAGRERIVYSSHDDESRFVLRAYVDAVVRRLATQGVAAFPAIEEESGVSFYRRSGVLSVFQPVNELVPALRKVANENGIHYSTGSAGPHGELSQFPSVRVWPSGSWFFEHDPAGYVNPRLLLEAQEKLASRHGVVRVRATCKAVKLPLRDERLLAVETYEGVVLRSDKVLVATGAFTVADGLLPRSVALAVKTEAVLLAEVEPEAASDLAGYPPLALDWDADGVSKAYLSPPIRFPGDRWYVKLGCNTDEDRVLGTLQELQAWYRAGPSARCQAAMASLLRRTWPSIRWRSFVPKSCAVSYTDSGLPIIDEIEKGLFVAVGGNGIGAKMSDTLGHLAAGLVTDDWNPTYERGLFAL